MKTTAAAAAQTHARRRRGLMALSGLEMALFLAGVIVVAWAIGVFDRAIFDDEVLTLRLADRFDLAGVFNATSTGYGAHGPFGYSLYEAVSFLPVNGMRLLSLLMSATAFALGLDLTLAALDHPRGAERYLIFGAFGLFPLLHGAGDALRSYPLTALMVGIFLWLYFKHDAPGIIGGAALGAAASTTVTPVIPYLAFAWRRYGKQRRFGRADVVFHVALLVVGLPGIANYLQAKDGSGVAFGNVIEATGTFFVGLLGGMRVGLSLSPLLLPLMAAAVYLTWTAWRNRGKIGTLAHSIVVAALVMLVLSLVMAFLSDVSRARTYLFAVPYFIGAVVIGAHLMRDQMRVVGVTIASFVLAIGAFAANYHDSVAPLKRNLAIPYTNAADFVQSNAQGDTLVLSSDVVLGYELASSGMCVIADRFRVEELEASPMYLPQLPACFTGDVASYATVIAIESLPFSIAPALVELGEATTASLRPVAVARFGEDRDTAVKRVLTGEDLPRFIVTITVYRADA